MAIDFQWPTWKTDNCANWLPRSHKHEHNYNNNNVDPRRHSVRRDLTQWPRFGAAASSHSHSHSHSSSCRLRLDENRHDWQQRRPNPIPAHSQRQPTFRFEFSRLASASHERILLLLGSSESLLSSFARNYCEQPDRANGSTRAAAPPPTEATCSRELVAHVSAAR